jgi:UDP-N-acetylmuramate dehydrogenase
MSVAMDRTFSSRVRRHEPMSRHTSWHVGGPAQIFFTPEDREDLAAFLSTVEAGVPIHFVGLGSNLLVRDGGLPGIVISTQGTLGALERIGESSVRAEAGVTCARIARQCVKWGLGPAEFFAGIPGTFGGALAMNAGAFGGETWRHIQSVLTIDRAGNTHRRSPSEYRIGYRTVQAPVADEWFIEAQLRFEQRPGTHADEIKQLLERRRASQPIGEWSCGSVFTNPLNDHAARLIEAAGLKGHRIGDASVSHKHANFIVNHGKATAADLERLIAHVRDTVLAVHGIALHPEVRIVGVP